MERIVRIKEAFRKIGDFSFEGLIDNYARNEVKGKLYDIKNRIDKILKGEYQIDHRGEIIAYSLGNQSVSEDTNYCEPIFNQEKGTIQQNYLDTVSEILGGDFQALYSIHAKIVPIDGKKRLLGFGNSHYDFVFFDENDFCFVEFKLNATSEQERAIGKNRDEAIKQLTNTISWFDLKLEKNYAGLNLEAYVCTPEFYYPRFNSSWGELAKDFLENYGFKLFEINYKICD